MAKLLSQQTTTLTDTLRRALLLFLIEDMVAVKHDLLRQTPGLRSPEVCSVLYEQLDIALDKGDIEGARFLVANLLVISRYVDPS